jgi:hypothetical protein
MTGSGTKAAVIEELVERQLSVQCAAELKVQQSV